MLPQLHSPAASGNERRTVVQGMNRADAASVSDARVVDECAAVWLLSLIHI